MAFFLTFLLFFNLLKRFDQIKKLRIAFEPMQRTRLFYLGIVYLQTRKLAAAIPVADPFVNDAAVPQRIDCLQGLGDFACLLCQEGKLAQDLIYRQIAADRVSEAFIFANFFESIAWTLCAFQLFEEIQKIIAISSKVKDLGFNLGLFRSWFLLGQVCSLGSTAPNREAAGIDTKLKYRWLLVHFLNHNKNT